MSRYVGPAGYGACPELAFSAAPSYYRMQSLEPFKARLTPAVKQEIVDKFAPYDAEVVKIDKTRKGYVRIWYNNCTKLYK